METSQQRVVTPESFHLSITGLRIRPGLLNRIRFTYHALRAYRQAARAPGNLHVAAGAVDGVQHTVTAWTDREAMLAFVRSGPHLEAMKAFHRIATGGTVGYEADRIPDVQEAHTIWKERAKMYTP